MYIHRCHVCHHADLGEISVQAVKIDLISLDIGTVDRHEQIRQLGKIVVGSIQTVVIIQSALHQRTVIDVGGSDVDILDNGVCLCGKRRVQGRERAQFLFDQLSGHVVVKENRKYCQDEKTDQYICKKQRSLKFYMSHGKLISLLFIQFYHEK